MIHRLTAADRARVEPLVRAYPFKAYRNYRVLPRRAQDAVMLAEVQSALESAEGAVFVAADGDREAAVVYRALPWDSTFFGVPMGRIDYVLGHDPRSPELAGRAVAAALTHCRATGVRHVTGRADVADLLTVSVLEAHGFRLMDSLVTYTTRPGKEPPHEVREMGAIRPLRPEDGEELVEIAREAYRGFRGRFHLDPHLPDDRCDALYVEWARQTLTAAMADTVLVSEGHDGRLLGFLAFRRREPVSSVGGVPIFGGGLGACRRDVPGAYAGLIRAGTLWAHERKGVAECQTQNYNFPTVRIYEAVGAHYVRADYTLHAWLG